MIDLRPTDGAKARVAELLRREKRSVLTAEEKAELDGYLRLEHIMRLVKARMRQPLSPDADGW